MLQAFLKDDSGASVIEYGLIAGLVSIAILAAVMSLGDSVNRAYVQVNDQVVAATGLPAAVAPGDASALEPILDGVAIAMR
jgi:pilus assembly protein Flp/PilA